MIHLEEAEAAVDDLEMAVETEIELEVVLAVAATVAAGAGTEVVAVVVGIVGEDRNLCQQSHPSQHS